MVSRVRLSTVLFFILIIFPLGIGFSSVLTKLTDDGYVYIGSKFYRSYVYGKIIKVRLYANDVVKIVPLLWLDIVLQSAKRLNIVVNGGFLYAPNKQHTERLAAISIPILKKLTCYRISIKSHYYSRTIERKYIILLSSKNRSLELVYRVFSGISMNGTVCIGNVTAYNDGVEGIIRFKFNITYRVLKVVVTPIRPVVAFIQFTNRVPHYRIVESKVFEEYTAVDREEHFVISLKKVALRGDVLALSLSRLCRCIVMRFRYVLLSMAYLAIILFLLIKLREVSLEEILADFMKIRAREAPLYIGAVVIGCLMIIPIYAACGALINFFIATRDPVIVGSHYLLIVVLILAINYIYVVCSKRYGKKADYTVGVLYLILTVCLAPSLIVFGPNTSMSLIFSVLPANETLNTTINVNNVAHATIQSINIRDGFCINDSIHIVCYKPLEGYRIVLVRTRIRLLSSAPLSSILPNIRLRTENNEYYPYGVILLMSYNISASTKSSPRTNMIMNFVRTVYDIHNFLIYGANVELKHFLHHIDRYPVISGKYYELLDLDKPLLPGIVLEMYLVYLVKQHEKINGIAITIGGVECVIPLSKS